MIYAMRWVEALRYAAAPFLTLAEKTKPISEKGGDAYEQGGIRDICRDLQETQVL